MIHLDTTTGLAIQILAWGGTYLRGRDKCPMVGDWLGICDKIKGTIMISVDIDIEKIF